MWGIAFQTPHEVRSVGKFKVTNNNKSEGEKC